MIHLGQIEGRKDHPEDATEQHDPDDLPIVHVDEKGNVVEIVENADMMPSTEKRREEAGTGKRAMSPDENSIREYIAELREQGKDGEADRAEKMLLGE